MIPRLRLSADVLEIAGLKLARALGWSFTLIAQDLAAPKSTIIAGHYRDGITRSGLRSKILDLKQEPNWVAHCW